MNRLELVTETLRAALNELAFVSPVWLRSVVQPEWFARYNSRVEDTRLPRGEAARKEFAERVGADGFLLLKRLSEQVPDLLKKEKVQTLQKVWERHYARSETGEVGWRKNADLPKAAAAVESPYDIEARHSNKRELSWTGYKVHLSETCDDNLPRLITNVLTTVATTQDVACTASIHQSLDENRRLPARHFVDAGYVDAALLIESSSRYGVELIGPTRLNPSWQSRTGGYDLSRFQIDWNNQTVVCPEGKRSVYWYEHQSGGQYARRVVKVRFNRKDCRDCANRSQCVKSESGAARSLNLPPQPLYEALEITRNRLTTEAGKREYQTRAGIEGTLSQAVRRGSLRQSRYRGLKKTHLQEIATATGINLLRTINFINDRPITKTRTSRFAKLEH